MAVTPLTPGEVASLLRGSLAMLEAEVAALPPALAGWHPAPGEWCIKEVIGHLIESERREFAVLREDGIALARRLAPDELGRGGHHPTVGDLRVADLLHEWVHHDRNHLKQILANVQRSTWPHMGNAQKFTGE